jgi:hypothetical protein
MVDLDLKREQGLLKATRERMEASNRDNLLKSRIRAIRNHLLTWKNDPEMRRILIASHEERKQLKIEILDKNDEDNINVSTSFTCPIDACNGVVKNGKCSDCKKTICAKCREERLANHECNSDTLNTIKLLKKDTKGCPRCKTPIYKIDGCDQMFCTNCKTAFSWRTLVIHTGIIHNPHYHEYMNQLGVGNMPIGMNDLCGEEFHKAVDELSKKDAYRNVAKEGTNAIINNDFVPRVLTEIQVILPILSHSVYDDEAIRQDKQKFREAYINQRDACEEKAIANWRNQLCLMYKRREIKKDLIKLIEIFDRGVRDFFVIANETGEYEMLFVNIRELVIYFKTQLIENEKKYNLKNKTKLSIDHGLQCGLVRY